jgi:uncharacterized protein YgiM (DUF1202 family)
MKTPLYLAAVFSLALCAPQIWADEQPEGSRAVPPAKPAKPAARADKGLASRPELTNAGTAIVRGENVNIRGQASISSEVVAKAKKGETVEVRELVTLKKTKTDEPAVWAKISLPASAGVWVSALFVDTNKNIVKVNKLNLRSGPGENFSTIGLLEKGAAIKPIETKNKWIKIEAPAEVFGFIAAQLLEPVSAPAIAAVTPPAPPPPVTPAPVETTIVTPPPATPPPAAIEPAPTVAVIPPAPVTPAPEPPATIVAPVPAAPANAKPTPPEEEVWVKRFVTREGIVKRSVSIQAPTYFVLESMDNKRVMNYIFSPSTNLVLKDFKGQRVIVNGEESLDERWRTPVLTVDTLQVVE